MEDIVSLSFVNEDSGETDTMLVDRTACEQIARWYGGYCAGDSYTISIDGEYIPMDLNGEIKL